MTEPNLGGFFEQYWRTEMLYPKDETAVSQETVLSSKMRKMFVVSRTKIFVNELQKNISATKL